MVLLPGAPYVANRLPQKAADLCAGHIPAPHESSAEAVVDNDPDELQELAFRRRGPGLVGSLRP